MIHYLRWIALSAETVEITDCPSPIVCSDYDIKQTDGEAPVVVELWEMRSTPSLWLFPGPLCPGVVAPDRVLSVDQIELFEI